MPRIPGISWEEAVRVFRKIGYKTVREGKHTVMSNGVIRLTIPRHNPINSFTMGAIAQDAGLTPRQFKELLKHYPATSKMFDGNQQRHSTVTSKQFFDWQTSGGTNDVMCLIDCLERADIAWCAIGGLAVNHWAKNPMVTQDVDIVVAAEDVERAVKLLEEAGFHAERFEWSINLKGQSALSIQCSTESFYREFPARAVPADVHGILMRVASLEDTLHGKMRAWTDPARRQSKRIKDLADIARLVEAHPHLWDLLSDELKGQVQKTD